MIEGERGKVCIFYPIRMPFCRFFIRSLGTIGDDIMNASPFIVGALLRLSEPKCSGVELGLCDYKIAVLIC